MAEKLSNELKELLTEINKKVMSGDYIYRGRTNYDDTPGEPVLVTSTSYRKYKESGVGPNNYDLMSKDINSLNSIKDRGHSENSSNNLEILAEMRHYGGEINLIDFTSNINIALYFACCDSIKYEINDKTVLGKWTPRDGKLFFIDKKSFYKEEDIWDKYETDDFLNDIFKTIEEKNNTNKFSNNYLFKPKSKKNRVIFQSSVLVHSLKGYIPFDPNGYIEIPHNIIPELLLYLKRNGVDEKSIYNDIHGYIQNENENSGLNNLDDQASFFIKNENYNRAKKILDFLIAWNPLNSRYYMGRAVCHLKTGKIDETIKDLKLSIEFNPKNIKYRNILATYYFILKKYKCSIHYTNECIMLAPKKANLYYQNFRCYLELFDLNKDDERYLENAMRCIDECLKLEPNNFDYLIQKLIIDPKNNTANIELGEKIILQLKDEIRQRKELVKNYENLGCLQVWLGEFDDALESYKTVKRLDPSVPDIDKLIQKTEALIKTQQNQSK